jgi:CubicO group peptidase (beta-lactamase class C family)
MLYGNEPDMGAYVASQARAADAGSVFNYSSGDTSLLALAFKNALKGQDPRAYAQSKLFGPAGITSALCEADLSGTPVLTSFCYMNVRDLAKFGQLYLDNGMSGGTQVVPASWVTYSLTPAPTVAAPISRLVDGGVLPGGSFGASWWLNAATPTASSDTWEYPDEPADEYDAEGHFGQYSIVVPSRHLVVARVGSDVSGNYSPDAMMQLVVAAVDKVADGGSN